VGLWFVVNSGHVLVLVDAVGDPRTAVTGAKYPPSSHLSYAFSFGARRPCSSALAISTSSRRSRWIVKPGLWFIDDLVSGYHAVNALAVPISSERVRRSMLCVARSARPLVLQERFAIGISTWGDHQTPQWPAGRCAVVRAGWDGLAAGGG